MARDYGTTGLQDNRTTDHKPTTAGGLSNSAAGKVDGVVLWTPCPVVLYIASSSVEDNFNKNSITNTAVTNVRMQKSITGQLARPNNMFDILPVRAVSLS